MKRLLPVLMGFVFLLLSSTEGWSADLQKGLDAAQRGDFATALREWKPQITFEVDQQNFTE